MKSFYSVQEFEYRQYWPAGDPDVDSGWEAFLAYASDIISEYDVLYLVKPSGSLQSLHHVRWNYPSFTSQTLILGVTADISNPYIRLAFANLGGDIIIAFSATSSRPSAFISRRFRI
jgi:hypothetical protein